MRVVFADALAEDALLALFNAGFSDYIVPMQLDAEALRGHVRTNDLDLSRSPVAVVAGEPAAFALVGIRGPDAWIGGMATAPAHRRAGLAAGLLEAAAEAAGSARCRTLWLEVIEGNAPAVALYRRAGYEVVRDLIVWTLAAGAPAPVRAFGDADARAWIAEHRDGREPWQRADATLARMREGGETHAGFAVERDGAVVGAALCRETPAAVTVLQAAARDVAAAGELLAGAAGPGRSLTLANAPAGGVLSEALAGLGATVYARQHEMRLSLNMP